MPSSPTSSHVSAPCRLEWRPSRWLTLTLFALGLLAAFSVLASEMPLAFAIPLALAAGGEGVRLARREQHRPARMLTVVADGRATLDGAAIDDVRLHWRGPLAFLRFDAGNGRRQRLIWWPDTLPAHERRELRLAFPVQPTAQPGPSMAS